MSRPGKRGNPHRPGRDKFRGRAPENPRPSRNAAAPVPAPAAGQPIKIRVSGQTQTNFDNVRLSLGDCYANCDGSVTPPVLNIADFSCFLNSLAAGNPYANCDDSTTPPVLNIADFSCFLNRFAAGCT
jgi:hypothetical protein